MGTDCQYKYGDRLPVHIIWGQIANKNTWGPFYFRDMWPHRSRILAPITAKTGTPKKGVNAPPFEWTPEMQKAFDQMKALMVADVLCAILTPTSHLKYTLTHPIINLVHV